VVYAYCRRLQSVTFHLRDDGNLREHMQNYTALLIPLTASAAFATDGDDGLSSVLFNDDILTEKVNWRRTWIIIHCD
jgi:hypothetical protein